MKIKTKILAFWALALLAGQALATSVTIKAGSGGGGVFYAIHRSDYVTDTTGSETTSKYGTSDSTASEKSLFTVRFFSYAFPNCGYNFQGWSTSASGSPASGYTTPIEQYYGIDAGATKTYYARFASGATVRDIYLCVGDQVTLYFYDATTGVSSSNPKWVTRLNDGTGSAFWTDTNAKSGNGATFTRSTASTSKAFSIQIKATTAGKTDTLVVRDTVVTSASGTASYDPKTYSVNTYHYRIHVSAARSLQEWTDTTITANSSISRAWSVSGVNTSLITVNNSAGSSASSSPTFTVHGVNYSASSPTATFTASNYDSGTTTGERGVSYTYSIPMTEAPKKTYYASATAAVSGSGGKAYVSSASTENTASYTTSQTSAGPLSAQSKYASATVGDFYLWAMPDFGYKCTGWGTGSSGAAVSLNYAHNASPITLTSSATSSSSPQTESYYAHFSNSGVAVKDIYLAVGDRVQLFYYNSTYAPFSARVNSTMLTATSATAGSYATYVRSAANTAAVQAFNMTVTATTASGSSYDQLTVQDHQGNVYHYRIHVTAARDVRIGTPSSVSEQSYYSAGWIVTVPSASSSYVSATVLPTGDTDSPTITFTGKAATASAVTVQVSNYDELPTTGCLGATYTYSMTVTDPPSYTYYARVATVVVGASGSGIGQGWAYASRKRQEDSSVYQTTRSVSELGSKKLYEDLASTEVDGFYIFAFPNSGYRFEGWSVDDPNGPIVSTEAFSASGASVSVTSTSKTQASPTEVTYYAHFVRADERVKDITLAVGDSVRLFFNNTTACNWSLQVVYTNGTEQVVNLDDTVAHAGGYANYTRSASTAPASASTAFNMLVEATRASGNDYDQLTIEDYAGNVYHYHVHVIDRRVIERHDTAVFSADSFATNVWSQSGIDTSVLTVSTEPIGVATNSATVHATGAVKCKDSRFTVSNYAAAARTGELGATYTFGMNVVEPWPVEFCQGDEVVIYYHNSVKKNWYLLINGNRVEPNVAGRGAQMTVTLSADNPDDDTEILGVATTPGTGSGDLVIVTDGENFYPYRMAVRPRRVIGLGESRSMKCSTVATSPWRYQVPSASSYYVDTDFSPNEDEGHSATITLTGKQPGKNVIVYVANFERDDASVNAQGAYYTLVTDVIGARTRGVYMSQGTSVTWGEGYLDATPSSTYSVTPSEANLMTAAIASNTATTVFTTLTAPDNAVPYTTALFTVKDQADADVAKYDVMAYGIMSMAVGQVAPGCLNGSATPWVMESSNPAKFSAEPTIYNKLNSGRMEAKAPGDFSVWATNAADQVYWYSIRVQVYDEVTRLIAIPDNGTTNITISAEPGLAAKWSLAQDCAHITASLDNTSTAADHVTLTVNGGTVEGSHIVQVNNAFHHERIEVFVGANPGQTVVKAGSLKFTAYNTVDLPGEAPPAAWTAQLSESAAGKFSLVAASGAAGEKVRVYGIAPGTGQVIVKTASTIYVYDVEVAKNDGKLSDVTVGAGYTFTTNLTDLASDLAGATLYETPDSMIATAYLSGNELRITGVQDGYTSLKLATSTYIYTLGIIVHERNIRKNITLYVGDDGTTTSYSYTFDRVVSVANGAPDRITVKQEDNTVIITPRAGAEGIAGATVECYVDGLSESSTLNYHITILQVQSGYRVRNFDEGYIAYKDADYIREPNGDLVFVYTNVNSAGSIIIPDGYSARVDILAVGGGGGGGSVATGFGRGGGGGGAGGYSSVTNKKMSAGTFGVQIGPGGLGLSTEIGGDISLPGSNGGASLVTNSFGYVIAAGNGGGGGAAPSPMYYSGLDGGSGGGGSWIYDDTQKIWVPGRGGLGISGQGCDGGTPTETNCGGGGGGASGNGGNGQTRGPGRYSDITGVNTLYSLGGFGGRSDTSALAQNGLGPGFGGDGGNGGPGGNGGDGTVVIRFRRLYQNVLVPIPTTNDLITARFQWEDGTNYVPIVYAGRSFRSPSNAHPYNWEDVFAKITGITNVVCEMGGDGGTNKVGVGYYNFYLTLKDGFAWDDGSAYGSLEKMGYRWVICEHWSDIDADINVHKTVWWSDKSNATIRVSSVASPEMSGGGTPKVLFLGSLCHAHSLAASTIVASLNAITERADVDYFLYQNDDLRKSGSLGMNETITEAELNVTLNYSSHSSLRAFYVKLYEKLVEGGNADKYDYIVMEFDGSRIAKYYVDNNDNKSGATIYSKFAYEREVAEALVPFYANEGVIWIVDNGDEKSGSVQYPVDEPFGHTSDAWTQNQGHSDLNEYWRPNTYLYSSGHLKVTDTQYQGLVGLFDPKHYISGSSVTAAQLATTSTTYAPRVENGQSGTSSVYYGNDRNELQAHYKDPEAVTNLLGTAIKVKPFNLYYQDKIVSPEEGLVIQDVTVMVCTTLDGDGLVSTNDANWKALMHWEASTGQYVYDDPQHLTGIPGASMEVHTSSNLVISCLSNINFKVGVRYDTHVLDAEGKFQTSDGANYNESTGQYEKNPNEGAAYVSLVNDLGVGIGVDGDAETEVPWRYTAYRVSGTAQNGSVFVSGTQYSSLSCPEGHDVTVYYRGNGGYRLTALRVDGNDVQVGGVHDNYYTFQNLQADHTVQVVYTAYYGTVTPCGATYEYDGVAHVPTVELEGWDASYDTQLRFALSEEGPYYTEAQFAEMYSTNRSVTCVGDHEVYCRVYAYQAGYGATIDEPGWVWVDTRVVEKGTVTITKKPLVITANSFNLSAEEAPNPGPLDQWRGVSVRGLVEGDTVNTNSTYLTWSCPTYAYAIGQYRVDPVYQSGKSEVDVAGNNYIVYLRPGVVSVIKSPMIIGGITQFGGLNPEAVAAQTGVDRVEITYNGEPTNLVIRVDEPTGAKAQNLIYKYSIDDGRNWTGELPTRLHVGTNKVWYVLEDGTDPEKALYFAVTNYNYLIVNPRPITFTAASATKVYDGTPLATNDYAITAGSLAPGDSVFSITVAGSRTTVGTTPNRVSGAHIHDSESDAANMDRTDDYAITYVDGALTVTPGGIRIGDVTYVPGGQTAYGYQYSGVYDVDKIYDGIGTNIDVRVVVPEEGYTILYTTNRLNEANIDWVPALSFTEAGNYAVNFLVQAENYADVTNVAYVIIRPRPLTVTALDARMRRGTLDPAYSAVVTYSDTGEVVPQEVLDQLSFTIAPTNSAYQTVDGDYDLVPQGEAVQGNYSLTFVPGTLTVDDKLDILYSLDGLTTMYDGEGHSITATVTNNAPNPVIHYALSPDGPWSDAPPVLTNATTGTRIYYAIESTAAYRAETNYVIQAITPHPATVTVGDFSKLRREPDPAFSAVVSGLLAGEESVASTFVYGYTREPGEDVGTNAVYATGATVQGNYTITYVPGHLEILPWLYPVGPNGEKIPIEEAWIGGKGGDDKVDRFHIASNYVFSEGANGVTNWMSYVLGLDPTNVNSVIYIDVEPNRASVKDPTLVARGAQVRPLPIGSLTNVLFRLMKCNSRTGTYERVTDTPNGRFPQTNVPTDFFRAETLFEFEQK